MVVTEGDPANPTILIGDVLLDGDPPGDVETLKYLGSMFVASDQGVNNSRSMANLAHSAFSRLQFGL